MKNGLLMSINKKLYFSYIPKICLQKILQVIKLLRVSLHHAFNNGWLICAGDKVT